MQPKVWSAARFSISSTTKWSIFFWRFGGSGERVACVGLPSKPFSAAVFASSAANASSRSSTVSKCSRFFSASKRSGEMASVAGRHKSSSAVSSSGVARMAVSSCIERCEQLLVVAGPRRRLRRGPASRVGGKLAIASSAQPRRENRVAGFVKCSRGITVLD